MIMLLFAVLLKIKKNADYKLGIFKELSIKHKCITAQPLLESINIEQYLDVDLCKVFRHIFWKDVIAVFKFISIPLLVMGPQPSFITTL